MDFLNILQAYFNFTNIFFENKSKKSIKEKSQYFTPIDIVDKMLEDLEIQSLEKIRILDPACGCGILLIKLLEKLVKFETIKIIEIDAYDIEQEALNITQKIINKINLLTKTKIKIKTYNIDFLKKDIQKKYDYIISNPPYKKTNKNLVEQDLMFLVNGQPNLYHLFIGKTLKLLKENGKLIIISPKNFLSGKYTENLRKFIFENFSITKLHTFNERSKIFNGEIIQEVCISHIENKKKNKIFISYNGNKKMELDIKNLILDSKKFIIMTPRNPEDVETIKLFNQIQNKSIGKELFIKIGKVVQFRVFNGKDSLEDKKFDEVENGIPLLVYRHINKGKINYREISEKSKNKAITLKSTNNDSLLIDNSNYVVLKKNIDKKENKIIKPVLYLKDLNCQKISIDNNLSYFTNRNDNLSREEVCGIFCILNSKQFDAYYRMINSSHTLNVYELESMFFPNMDIIKKIGIECIDKNLTIDVCTKIFEKCFVKLK